MWTRSLTQPATTGTITEEEIKPLGVGEFARRTDVRGCDGDTFFISIERFCLDYISSGM